MERTTVILTGRVGSDVIMHVDQQGGTPFSRFRLVVPRGRWNDQGTWEEQEGAWYTVKAWGNLALNAHHSLRKGQPVIVVGRPSAQGWLNKENKIATEIAVNASAIGHDLARGVSAYGRVTRETEGPTEPVVGSDSGVDHASEAGETATEAEAGVQENDSTDTPASDGDYETAQVEFPAA